MAAVLDAATPAPLSPGSDLTVAAARVAAGCGLAAAAGRPGCVSSDWEAGVFLACLAAGPLVSALAPDAAECGRFCAVDAADVLADPFRLGACCAVGNSRCGERGGGGKDEGHRRRLDPRGSALEFETRQKCATLCGVLTCTSAAMSRAAL